MTALGLAAAEDEAGPADRSEEDCSCCKIGRLEEELVVVVRPVGKTSCFLRQHRMLEILVPMLVENRQ